MDHQEKRQLELHARNSGSTAREVLMQTVRRAQAEKDQALEKLRAVMFDAEALKDSGINVDQAGRGDDGGCNPSGQSHDGAGPKGRRRRCSGIAMLH